VVRVDRNDATVELSLPELGLLINALWQDLGYQAARDAPIDEDLRVEYDALQRHLTELVRRMDSSPPSPRPPV
jgi:hypothetical protein